MAKNYKALRDSISPERCAANEAAAKEMLAEMPMHSLRDALHFTQQQLAEELGIKQGSISKMERRPDHLVSTRFDGFASIGYGLFYPDFTDGLKRSENCRSFLATLRRILGL